MEKKINIEKSRAAEAPVSTQAETQQSGQKLRYKLADLIAELPAGELPKVDGWDDIKPVGREVW